MGQGQKSCGLRSKVDLEGQGHQVKKSDFRSHLIGLPVLLEVKGQKSRDLARSKVTWLNPSLKFMILAGGLTSTSSCFIFILLAHLTFNLGSVVVSSVIRHFKNTVDTIKQ